MKRCGFVLGMVIIMAVAMTIAAYTALFVAVSTARLPTPLDETRARARFASEAGIVWAKECLYENCSGVPQDQLTEPDDAVTVSPPPTVPTNGMQVRVTITNTGQGYEIQSAAFLP